MKDIIKPLFQSANQRSIDQDIKTKGWAEERPRTRSDYPLGVLREQHFTPGIRLILFGRVHSSVDREY